MECRGCNDKQQNAVPYVAHEAALARMERTIRRLWILALVLIGLLLATNTGWIWYESQFEDVVTEVTQEAEAGDSGSEIINGEKAGAIIYGESEADN